MSKFLNNISLEAGNDIQFKTTAGSNAGKIEQVGDNLVLSNTLGDVLLGDGASDVYIGDGTNNVDIVFEQSGSIRGDGSAITLTLGGSNTTLNLENPNINGTLSLTDKLSFTSSSSYILFDYEPTTAGGEYTSEVPLLKVDRSGSELTILSRLSNNGAIALGNDDTVAIIAGDTKGAIKDNIDYAGEKVVFAAEGGFHAYGFPSNDTTWSNRNEFRFRSDSGTASENGLYIGDGGNTQFIDLSRNLKNIGTISSGAITSSGSVTATSFVKSGGTTNQFLKANGNVDGTAYAPLASPALTGTPTAPTAAANTNTTQIATTAYVQTELSDLIGGAPTALDTLNELAAAINDDSAFSSTVTTALGNRLRIDINNQGLTSTQQGYGRTNLGLGTAATSASTAFATAAQGTSAETAYGWGDHSLAGYLTTSAAASTYSVIAGSTSLTTAGTLTVDQLNMRDVGDYITFYGDNNGYHAIGARNTSGAAADDIRINSYGGVYINLDSNNNDTSAGHSSFKIGRHGGQIQNGTISDWLFTVDGENGNVTVAGTVDGRDLAVDGSKLDNIAANANNYSLPLAASGTRGGVQIGYAENGQNYPVELSSEKMFVNVPWTDNNTTYSAGNGISLSGTTFSVAAGSGLSQDASGLSHSDTSSQASVNNTGGTVIQDINLDGYGHITGIGSVNLDSRYFTETESDARFLGITAKAADSEKLDGVDGVVLAQSLRAGLNVSGGGTITVSSGAYIKNSSRFIVIASGKGSNFATSGYWDINIPTSGTITGVGGASNATATSDGVPLAVWEALYYILPIGSGSSSQAANFRIVDYTANVDIPYNWILLAVRNGDSTNNQVYFLGGKYILGIGQSINTLTYNSRRIEFADKLTTTRNIALTGAVTGNANFDGSGNISIATTATADPTLTINGDASGSATFTNLGNATLTLTIADDSHNHTIANVDGLQTALDGKSPTAGSTSITTLGTIGTGTWAASAIADNYISSSSTWNTAVTTANNALARSGGTMTGNINFNNTDPYGVDTIGFNTDSDKVKVRLYNNETTYGVGMYSGNTYGGLSDWSMTFQFSNSNSRGFWWGDNGHSNSQGAMALTTDGKLTVADKIRVGYGESDTTTPATYDLDVDGDVSVGGTIATGGTPVAEVGSWLHVGRQWSFSGLPFFNKTTGSTAQRLDGAFMTDLNTGTAASRRAQAVFGGAFNDISGYSGAGTDYSRALGASIKAGFFITGQNSAKVIFAVGLASTSGVYADADPISNYGFGVEFRRGSGSVYEWRVFGHNGTTLTASSWSSSGITYATDPRTIAIYSDGSGNITAYTAMYGDTNYTTITTTGGPTATSGTSTSTNLVGLRCNTNASGYVTGAYAKARASAVNFYAE